MPSAVDLSAPIWTIDHVAAALHLSTDRAREYTYSPAPRAGFGRNLWLRQDVLDWFEGLPPGQRRATTTARTRRPAQPREPHTPEPAMSARRQEPIETVGAVGIYEPTGSSPYYHLRWFEPDGYKGDTTGGRTLAQARAKAADIDDRLAIAAGPQAVTTPAVIAQEYLKEARSPNKDRRPWKKSHRVKARTGLDRMLRGRDELRAIDLTREVAETMGAQAGTANAVTTNSSGVMGY